MTGAGPRPACFKSTFSEVLFVLAATMSVSATSFLAGGLTVVTARIGNDLNMTNAEVTWITASSQLAAGSFLLFFGRLADLFGRKSMFVGSLFLFALFCLAAGFAKTGISFDILNGFLGLWSASAVPASIGILGAVYEKPSKRKNYAFATFSAGNPLGFVFGSVACGICTKILGWRSFLFLMAIIYGIFSVIAFVVVPVDTSAKQPWTWATLKGFDIGGTILTIGGFGLVSTSLSLAGDAPEGWRTPYVPTLLAVGVVLVGVFLWWETRVSNPLVPMWVWRDRDFSLLLLILFCGFGAFTAVCFWSTLFLQRFWSDNALMVAVWVLPMAIMGIIVNVIAGLFLHRISNKLLMAIGVGCYCVAYLVISFNKVTSSYWAFIFPCYLLHVWGADLQFNVANMYVMTSLSRAQQSTGGGIFQTVSRLSATVVLGITTAIFNAVSEDLPKSGYHGNDPSAAYAATYYFAAAMCAASALLVPFLRVGTQGNATVEDTHSEVSGSVESVVEKEARGIIATTEPKVGMPSDLLEKEIS